MGCMVDMTERTMMFTLNGEILLDDSGSELAFKDFDVGDGKCLGGGTRRLFALMPVILSLVEGEGRGAAAGSRMGTLFDQTPLTLF